MTTNGVLFWELIIEVMLKYVQLEIVLAIGGLFTIGHIAATV